MQTRTIGNDTTGVREVGAVGLGAMAFLQPAAKPREQIVATLRAALEAGVTLIDTADAYGPNAAGRGAQGMNETVLSDALAELGVRDEVLIATKGGHVRGDGGSWETNSTPAHLLQSVDDSLRRLGVEHIDLYQHHRPDPTVDYGDTMRVMKDIAESGKVRMIGISNADPDQIRQAHDILGDHLVSVQNQYSPGFRSSRPELDLCTELGLAFLPWSPLGGIANAASLGDTATVFQQVADEIDVSPQRVALAWMLAASPVVIPIPGASRPESITDSAAAADLTLSDEQLARLDAA